mgnify:CR=1 FL=1
MLLTETGELPENRDRRRCRRWAADPEPLPEEVVSIGLIKVPKPLDRHDLPVCFNLFAFACPKQGIATDDLLFVDRLDFRAPSFPSEVAVEFADLTEEAKP